MGQGTFTAILWGTTNIRTLNNVSEEAWEKFDDIWVKYDAKISYECNDRYCGIMLLADGGMGGDTKLCKELDHFAIALARFPQKVEELIGAKNIERAKEKWDKLRDAARKIGIYAPPGEFIIINDYD